MSNKRSKIENLRTETHSNSFSPPKINRFKIKRFKPFLCDHLFVSNMRNAKAEKNVLIEPKIVRESHIYFRERFSKGIILDNAAACKKEEVLLAEKVDKKLDRIRLLTI